MQKEAAIVPAPVSVEIGEMMALLGIAQATRRKEHEGGGGGAAEVWGWGRGHWTWRAHS